MVQVKIKVNMTTFQMLYSISSWELAATILAIKYKWLSLKRKKIANMNEFDSEDLRAVKTSKLSMFGGVQLKETLQNDHQNVSKYTKTTEYYKV